MPPLTLMQGLPGPLTRETYRFCCVLRSRRQGIKACMMFYEAPARTHGDRLCALFKGKDGGPWFLCPICQKKNSFVSLIGHVGKISFL